MSALLPHAAWYRLLLYSASNVPGHTMHLLTATVECSPDQLACQVQEGLLVVVVALGADLIVLQVLLAVEGDLLGLHLAVLHVHLVAAQHDGDVFTHPA